MTVAVRVLLLLACALLAAPAAARPPDDLPVAWTATAFFAGGSEPDRIPGANDFDCRPSRAHPRPVVLVHGTLLNAGSNWASLAPLLHNQGFCVFARTFGRPKGDRFIGGVTGMRRSARVLARYVDRVLEATGARKVDMVGHSSGTIMPRWYLRELGGARHVKRFVALAPFWRGARTPSTTAESLRPLLGDRAERIVPVLRRGAGRDMTRGSSFLRRINRAPGPAVRGVEFTSIVTREDATVPYRTGLLAAPNVTNLVVQDVCREDEADHIALAFDPLAAQAMLNALAPRRALPLPCAPMHVTGSPNPPAVGLR